MAEHSFQDAVQVLKDHLGNRWDGVELDGRDEMAKLLKDKLGYNNKDANDAIDAMVESGLLRYHRAAEDTNDVVPPVLPVGAATTGGAAATGGAPGSGLTSVPLVGGEMGGYWQIGDGDSDVPGRAGQVTPSL